MLSPAMALTADEVRVLDASTRSLALIHDIETALFLSRPMPDEPITNRLPHVVLQSEILTLLHGPGWHDRPEAVALLT